MANPSTNDVHINGALTNLVVEAYQRRDGFVADVVFPNMSVQHKSNNYHVIDRDTFNQQGLLQTIAPGAAVPESGYEVGNAPYSVDVFKQGHPIPDETKANADPILQRTQQIRGGNFLMNQAMMRREARFVRNFMAADVWGTTATPTNKWNSDGNPVTDIRTAVDTISENTGVMPNTIVMGRKAFSALMDNSNVRDRFEGGATTERPSVANRNLLAQVFEVDRVEVSYSSNNTAEPGATANHAHIMSDDVLVCYTPDDPETDMMMAGVHFVWTGFVEMAGSLLTMENNPMGIGLTMLRDEHRFRDMLYILMADDPKITDKELGYLFRNVNT